MKPDIGPTQPKRRRIGLYCIIAMLVSAGVLYCATVLYNLSEPARIRYRLIHHVDHVAILKASRGLMHRFPHQPNAEAKQFRPEELPPVIRDLHPSYVFLGEDALVIEMGGGFYHHGLFAYREGINREDIRNRGGVELIDGLWYHVRD